MSRRRVRGHACGADASPASGAGPGEDQASPQAGGRHDASGMPRSTGQQEVGKLFRQRWHAEVDIRTLKSQMQMEMLRTKSPEMVGKEVAVHLLGE